MTQRLSAELIAEFIGTFVLILFGNGVVAMDVLFNKGGYTDITIAWGLAVTMGIYIAGKVTGAHLNPAVTIALAAFRGFSWGKVLPYIVVQTAGAFAAAAVVYWNYRPQFHKIDPLLDHTAGSFHDVSGVSNAADGGAARPDHRHGAAAPDDFRDHR